MENQDFFTDAIPSLKASLGLQRISLGSKLESSKDNLKRYFSIPFCLQNKKQGHESQELQCKDLDLNTYEMVSFQEFWSEEGSQ